MLFIYLFICIKKENRSAKFIIHKYLSKKGKMSHLVLNSNYLIGNLSLAKEDFIISLLKKEMYDKLIVNNKKRTLYYGKYKIEYFYLQNNSNIVLNAEDNVITYSKIELKSEIIFINTSCDISNKQKISLILKKHDYIYKCIYEAFDKEEML
jgi:hypothetical protein